uniref:EH domain-binding protein 1 n=1 Tax=Parastrongyloides trichosuri TaxID=131310 RepID=A0A0N4ZPA7_PARTI
MNVMKKIRRDGKTAAKIRFTVTPKELILQHTQRWSKDETIQIVIAIEHGNRRYMNNKRTLEPSFIDLSRGLIAWPESLVDPIKFTTTIYRDKKSNEFMDKKWYITAYEINEKKKKKTLAVCPLNVKFFMNSNFEVSLKLKSGNSHIESGQLKLIIKPEILNEIDTTDESDRGSLLSFNSSARVSEDREFEKIPISEEKIEEKEEIIDKINSVSKSINLEFKRKSVNEENDYKPSIMTDIEIPRNGKIIQESIETRIEDMKPSTSEGTKENIVLRCNDDKKCSVEYQENESLSNWAVRVTKGYRSVRISDFSRSWKNGLALCAVIHKYRPDLISSYNSLSFTNTIDGMSKNCHIAFEAGKKLGVTPTMDEREWATLPDQTSVKSYVENLRTALLLDAGQIDSTVSPNVKNNKRESDHRISSYLQLTETEKSITEEFAKLKREREEADAVDYRNVPEVSDEDLHKNGGNKVRRKESLADELKLHKISNRSEIRREEAKQLLEKAAKDVNGDMDEERRKKLKEEAKKLINDALDDSVTSQEQFSGNLKRTASIRSTNGSIGGSSNDLRNLSLASRDFSFRKFKKINPSPSLSKKTKTETPLIPACSRPSRKISNQGSIENLSKSVYMPYPRSQSQSHYSSQTSLNDSNDSYGVWDKFDRFKRYGSMRGQELAGNISEYLKKNSFTNLTNIQPIAPSNFFSQYTSGSENKQSSNTDTPTRKLVNKWEKDIQNMEKISIEQQRIQERLNEIEYLDKALRKKMVNVCPGSGEESTLITQILEFTTEKDKLVLEQDYFNALENLRDVSDKITKTQSDLVQVSSEYEEYKQEKDRIKMDSLMKELKHLMDEKDDLTQNLIYKEDEEDETLERSRLTLERGSNFQRGNEQPISASKRIFNWIKS